MLFSQSDILESCTAGLRSNFKLTLRLWRYAPSTQYQN